MENLTRWLSRPLVGQVLIVVAGLVVLGFLSHLARRTIGNLVRDSDARYRARKFVTLVSYLAATLLISVVFSDRLGGLTVAFGVAGAGIAFALQEVIASVAGWLAVSLGGFFNVGDRVQLGGIKGDVIDITVLRTTLMECGEWVKGDLYTGRIVRVANSFVFKEPVFNYSGDFPFLWDEITVPVKHGGDHRLARTLLEEVAEAETGEYGRRAQAQWDQLTRRYKIEDARVAPTVSLSVNDNWMEFTIRYTVDYKERRGTRDRLFTRILDAFDRSEGKVALASATFHLVEAPTIDVRLAR